MTWRRVEYRRRKGWKFGEEPRKISYERDDGRYRRNGSYEIGKGLSKRLVRRLRKISEREEDCNYPLNADTIATVIEIERYLTASNGPNSLTFNIPNIRNKNLSFRVKE